MPFRPSPNIQLTIRNQVYMVCQHPAAPGMAYGQSGRRALVYQLRNGDGDFFALKVFNQTFRTSEIEQGAKNLQNYASLPGLVVCKRLVLSDTQAQDAVLLQQYPDLRYAALMPWVQGSTWQEVILTRMEFKPRQSYQFANGLVNILAGMERSGLAHCDLSGANVLLPGFVNQQPPVALVDVEEMYIPKAQSPAKRPAGSLGYNHPTTAAGLWSAEVDRFAGAILIAEMLGWFDTQVQQSALIGTDDSPGEQYFGADEMQQPCQRFEILRHSLGTHWSASIADLFMRAWGSATLAACPSFAEWQNAFSALTVRLPVLEELSLRETDKNYKVQWRPKLDTNALIGGRYRISEMFSDGGFGTVYLAIDTRDNSPCVLKKNKDISEENRRQFAHEADLLRGLSHRNLVKVLDYLDIPNDGQYIVMELIQGDDLQSLMARRNRHDPMDIKWAMSVIDQVCDALSYLHTQNPPVIHRDVKPANIRITGDGRAVLIDFGIAKIVAENTSTTLGARAVSPGFSPPEQYGQNSTDARTDIYALGATVWSLLTGRAPQASVDRQADDNMFPLSDTLLRHLVRTLKQALALNPAKRFQTVAAFKIALHQTEQRKINWMPMLLVIGVAGLVCLSAVFVAAGSFFKTLPAFTPKPGVTVASPVETLPFEPPATELFETVPSIPVATDSDTIDILSTDTPNVNTLASQRIVYASGGEQSAKRSIFIDYVNVSSKARERITTGTDQFGDNYPTFSPDGNLIAFTRCYQNQNDGCALFVKDLNTSKKPRLVLSGRKVMRPKWCITTSSPYSDWVVFEDRGKNGNNYVDTKSSLGLVNTTTGEFRQLTNTSVDWSANWSPDCSHIIFTRYADTRTNTNADLMLFNLDSGDETPLSGLDGFSPPAEVSPAWSPNGQWIAYRDASTNDLWLVKPDGSNAHALIADASYPVASLSWSPDSANVVFATQNSQMFVCDLQGNITHTFNGSYYLHTDWAP